MTALKSYLNSRKVQKVLSTRPGQEGFSLIELVVVIAVLAILAAVAIPAFNGIQNDARASAVKSGMANGIKECLVLEARGKEGTGTGGGLAFSEALAFQGDYKAYTIAKWTHNNRVSGCFGVKATPTDQYDGTLPSLYMAVVGTGEVVKACGGATKTDPSDWDGIDGEDFCW